MICINRKGEKQLVTVRDREGLEEGKDKEIKISGKNTRDHFSTRPQ